MLAANVWHWWIGVIVTLVVIGALVLLIASYFKFVVALKYEPGGRKRRRQSSDL